MHTLGELLFKVEQTRIIGVPKQEMIEYFYDPKSYLKAHSRHHRLSTVLSGQRSGAQIPEKLGL